MTNLKKLTDEELEAELDRRWATHMVDNEAYQKIHKQEQEAWKRYCVSVYAAEDVRTEINRRNKKLRKEMKPFHTFVRKQSKDYWPVLESECICGIGWFAKVQSSWVKGASVSECRDMLDEMELEHLKDVRDESINTPTIKGEQHGTGSGNSEGIGGDGAEADGVAGHRQQREIR